MARMTEKLVKQIWLWTNTCYKDALLNEYPEYWKKYHTQQYLSQMDDTEMKIELHQAGLPFRSPAINDRYLSHLLKLSSDQLSLVIEADQKGKIKRSPVTIHAILDELLHRGAGGGQYDRKS